MKFVISVLLALFLTACGPIPVKPDQVVEKVITVKCKKPNINVPVLFPFDKAKKENLLEDNLKLALSELEMYRGYTKELRAALDSCSE